MATYSSFAQLQGKQLKCKDCIVFEYDGYEIVGTVYALGLGNILGFCIENNIFTLLGLNAYDFCEQHYSKLPDDWNWRKTNNPTYWPTYYEDDYGSITKVVLELFAKIEKIEELAETSTTLFID